MDKKQLVMVTGMSGAGKTSAMAAFENMEFQCIDNYPVLLLKEFGELLKSSDVYNKVAMAVHLDNAIEAINVFSAMDFIDLTIIFLDCENDLLLTRYKFTRRVHPLIIEKKALSLADAIEFERKLAKPVCERANIILDTSKFSIPRFQERLQDLFSKTSTDPFRITFVSFGYKNGIPKDADLLFDVRFLPNPYYDPNLRNLTGNDKEVYDYVMDKPETQEYVTKMVDMFDYFFENFDREGKMHLVVGIGCTGGQHRSVTLTNYFSNYYSTKYQVVCLHRDATH